MHAQPVAARCGNGDLRLTSRELRAVDELVAALMRSLQRRLPVGLELVELEVELGRRRDRARPDRSAA